MGQLVGINWGSGQRRFVTNETVKWINCDCVSRPELQQVPDIVVNDTIPLPFESESIDFVVLWHVLEHYGCDEGRPLLMDFYRVLRRGGQAIIATPNLKALAVRWLTGQLPDDLYLTNIYGAYMGEPSDRHAWGFTQMSLERYLADVAPWQVEKWDGMMPIGSDLNSDWWMAIVRCTKL